ncbi:MAG TPA: hypothetical protein PLO25_02880, partial [Candidatus Saccharibacteria bacterium]|nr:hypothetical protein [Candidatus Saccharibacteria bacterium]
MEKIMVSLRDYRVLKGFALPVILISSTIMLTVLLVTITTTSTVRNSLFSQNYDAIAKSASESGLAYAQACIEKNGGGITSRWTESNPLKPDTDCSGIPITTCASQPFYDACHYVLSNDYASDDDSNPNLVSTFEVTGSVKFQSIFNGYYYACAVDVSGIVYCWGMNNTGQLGTNSTIHSSKPVPVYTLDTPMENKTIKSISADYSHTCALDTAGAVYCWGNNGYGRLGNNSTTQSLVPVAVTTAGTPMAGKTIQAISTGEYHTCALDTAGAVYCWGYNDNGQLGNNSTTQSLVPVAVTTAGTPMTGKTIQAISTGDHHTCALDTAGAVYCWGSNEYGQLGDNSRIQSLIPIKVYVSGIKITDYRYKQISGGDSHTCALDTAGAVYCWGSNKYGQLGNNSTTHSRVPATVTTAGTPMAGKTIQAISVGQFHTCALDTAGAVYCWGNNNYGQLGNNSSTNSLVPATVTTAETPMAGKTIQAISAGYYHTCALDTAGAVYCWGYNVYGQLGNNSTTTHSRVPVAVTTAGTPMTGKTIQAISVGYYHTCALDTAGAVYCWGSNSYGKLGNN